MLFSITANAETNEWTVTLANGDACHEADAFFHMLVESKLALWRARTNDSPPVEFVEWLQNPPMDFRSPRWLPPAPDVVETDEARTEALHTARLSEVVHAFSPKPWKGHPAYEG